MDNTSNNTPLMETTATANSPTSTSTFMPFRRLPIEVRFKIWHLALPGPRVVEVTFSSDPRSRQHEFIADFPVQLHVCRESRAETLRTYELCFDTKQATHPTYFNFNLDILYVRESNVNKEPFRHARLRYVQISAFLRKLPAKEKIQRLAISKIWSSSCMLGDRGTPLILSFPKLKEVRILLDMFTKKEWHYGGSGGVELNGKRAYFPEVDEELLRSKIGFDHHDLWGRKEKISKFLELQSKEHWGPIQWNKPTIIYTEWCSKYVSEEEWNLKAIPEKVHNTRSSGQYKQGESVHIGL